MNLLKHLGKILNARYYCSNQRTNVLEHLKNRKLIRIAGAETSEFLQGLVTNDIHHLDHGMGSLYAMFLNTKGRVLYDTLIYKTEEKDMYLIECDVQAVEPLKKHLKMYRVKRKIDVDSTDHNVYAVYNPEIINNIDRTVNANLDGLIVPCSTLKVTKSENTSVSKIIGNLLVYQDPRIVSLGSRVIAPGSCDVQTELSKTLTFTGSAKISYRGFRYYLGVGEGVDDLPPNDCFPLEVNCDYLHGVSFHKGCYIGQELTARTHHTGVVRKRLMPLLFQNRPSEVPSDNKILHDKVNLGKLRGVEGDVGLALLRIAQAIEIKNIKIGDGVAVTGKPHWWPLEAPKEKMSA